jgi:serine phosphatase RsbU (regulator of sigma subunit)
MNRKSLIFLLLFTALNNSSAQDVLKISSVEKANEQFSDYIYLYVDTTNSLDINDILEKKNKDLLFPIKKYIGKTSSENTYWLYFSIENNLTDDYPLGLYIPKQNHTVDIYSFSDTLINTQKTGFYAYAGKNDEIIPYTNTVFLKPEKRITIFLKIKNINDENPDFSIELADLDKEIKHNNQVTIFDGLLQGILWVMIFYGFVLFALNSDRLYLFYSLYIISISLWYFGSLGLAYRLFPGFPRVIFPYLDIPAFMGYIFYIQFIRLFIETPDILPKWNKVLRLLQIVLIIEIVRISIFVSFTNLISTNYHIQNIIASLTLIIIIFFIVRLLSFKSRLIRIITIGTSFLLLGTLVSLFHVILFVKESPLFVQRIGTLAELFVFTFAISYRYHLIELDKQRYHKRLISQLRENADLHEKVNRELAEKVKERTLVIEEQRDIVISQKNRIEIINKEITDSINYAKYIQSSVLPKPEQLESCLGDHFILYKPKDIVSGDFYWISNIDNKTIIVISDCTGHGVPGAFMSMLGITLLNEIVDKEKIINPGEILDRLRKEIIVILKQKGERLEQKDGMDIVICTLDIENMKLHFAGAINPLYLIRKAGTENVGIIHGDLPGPDNLIEIKGNHMTVGIMDNMDNFTSHEIDLLKGDTFYLFSDGFADQFGGPDHKKFSYRQFREQLIKTKTTTMPDQKIILEKIFDEWKGNNSQTDDILVLGFRIK